MGDLFFFLEKPFKFSFGANDSFVRFVDLEECDGPKSERQPETWTPIISISVIRIYFDFSVIHEERWIYETRKAGPTTFIHKTCWIPNALSVSEFYNGWSITFEPQPQVWMDHGLGNSNNLSRKCVIPGCVCETRKRYVVKHNLITEVYLMTIWWNNYMFRPVLAIFRLSRELKG